MREKFFEKLFFEEFYKFFGRDIDVADDGAESASGSGEV